MKTLSTVLVVRKANVMRNKPATRVDPVQVILCYDARNETARDSRGEREDEVGQVALGLAGATVIRGHLQRHLIGQRSAEREHEYRSGNEGHSRQAGVLGA